MTSLHIVADYREPSDRWQDHAACRGEDPEQWFATDGGPDNYTYPRSVCDRCPVKAECLDFAIDNGERHGMWGGKSPREREAERRRRSRARVKARREAIAAALAEGKKQCKKCGAVKPFADFNRNVLNLDGHEGNCADCRYQQRKASR